MTGATQSLRPARDPFWQGRGGLVLLSILLLGAVLRLAGLGFGLPLDLRPDEDIIRRSVGYMVERQTLNPHWFSYPGLFSHLILGLLFMLQQAAHLLGLGMGQRPLLELARDPVLLTWIQRLFSATCGLLTICLAAAMGRRLGGRRAGLLAALFLALAPLHVRDSHFGTVDVFTGLLVMLALLLILRAARLGSLGAFFLAGAASGLAAAAKYLPVVLVFSLLAAHGLCWRRERGSVKQFFLNRRLALALFSLLGVFLVAAPYTLLDWQGFLEALAGLQRLSAGWAPLDPLTTLRFHLFSTLGLGMGWPLLLLALPILAAPLWRRFQEGLVLSLFVLTYLAVISWSHIQTVRYGIPLLPVLAVCAACALSWLWQRGPRPVGRFLGPVLVLVSLALPAYRSFATVGLLVKPTSFELLARFIKRSLPPGVPVAFTSGEVVRILGPRPLLLPDFNPVQIGRQRELYLVVSELPHPNIGFPRAIPSLLKAMRGSSEVLRIQAFATASWKRILFDRQDAFYYPLAGFWDIARGGPNVTVYHLVGPYDKNQLQPPDAPPRGFAVIGTPLGLKAIWSASSDRDVMAYALHVARDEPGRGPVLLPPLRVPAGHDFVEVVYPPRGRWRLAVSALNLAGEGPWSPIVRVEVKH